MTTSIRNTDGQEIQKPDKEYVQSIVIDSNKPETVKYVGKCGVTEIDISKFGTTNVQGLKVSLRPDMSLFVYDDMMATLDKCDKLIGDIPDGNYDRWIKEAWSNESNPNLFHYKNSVYSSAVTENNDYANVNNEYLFNYENIIGITKDKKFISLNANTQIIDFINSLDENNTRNIIDSNDYTGAFLHPDVDSINSILTSGDEKSSIVIKPGESISIPLTFEYYIDPNSKLNDITKSIVFAIRDSLSTDEKYYEIEVTGNKSASLSNSVYSSIDNFVLSDSLTDN